MSEERTRPDKFERVAQGYRFSERRGPATAAPSVAPVSWGDQPPAVAPEHRGSLADAEADAGYRWAAGAVEGRDVLDLGCGAGHGSAILAAAGAASVLGVDRDERAIELATRTYSDSARFQRSEPEELTLTAASFGAVVCLGLLERGSDPEALLNRLRGLLAPGGVLLASLPTEPPRDPVDGRVLGPARDRAEWLEHLGEGYAHVKAYRRRIAVAAIVLEEGDEAAPAGPPGWLGADPTEDRAILLAASSEPLPELEPATTMVGSRDLRAYREVIAAWEQRARRAEADGSAKHWELVASREAQRRLRLRLWQLEHRPLRKLWRLLRGRSPNLKQGPKLRPPERDNDSWV